MNHDEIRFRILHILYEKYYDGGLMRTYSIEDVIKESGLETVERNLVLGDILYLKNKGFVNGDMQLGVPHPTAIGIETFGIDTLENFVTHSMNKIITEDLDIQTKDEIEEIRKEESITSKVKKWYNFIISRPEMGYVQEVLRL